MRYLSWQVLARSCWPAWAPSPGRGPPALPGRRPLGGAPRTHFSAGIHDPTGQPDANPAFQIQVLKELGLAYTRTQVSPILDSDKPVAADYRAYVAAGLKVLLNLRDAASSTPTITNGAGLEKKKSGPPPNLGLYKTQVAKILDKYRPALVVVENEENGRLYTGTPAQYIAQLQTATQVAHQKGYKVANGGMTGIPLSLVVWKDLWGRGLRAQADDFARRAFDTGRTTSIDTALPCRAHPTRTFPPAVADLTARYNWTLAEVHALRHTSIDYVNFHWYQQDAKAFGQVADYLRRVTGKAVISNEVGAGSSSPKIVTGLLSQALSQKMVYLNWFSRDVTTKSGQGQFEQARALQNPDGSLRPTGRAFAMFVRGLGPWQASH